MGRSGSKAWGELRGLAATCAFVPALLVHVLLANGLRPFWGPDEGRYVAGALKMLRRHDFGGIWLNDETPHSTKPPKTYWAISAAVAVFGLTEFVVRLPSALALVAAKAGLAQLSPADPDGVRDTGCSMKVFRRELVDLLVPFRGLHRYLPAIFASAGARIVEVPVNHRPRRGGASKYDNWSRARAGIRDIFGVAWLIDRKLRLPPMEEKP